MNFLQNYTGQIQLLCKKHKVKSLFAFGSVISDVFSSNSDIDLIVDFEEQNPLDYSENYFQLKFQLQDLLKRPVDLLEKKALHNQFLLKQIDSTKVPVYGK